MMAAVVGLRLDTYGDVGPRDRRTFCLHLMTNTCLPNKRICNLQPRTYGDVVPRVWRDRRLGGGRQTGVCGPVGPEAFGLGKEIGVETHQQPVALSLDGSRQFSPTQRT